MEEHALLRRLITVAGDIAEIGYSLPDDIAGAVDQAEALVFDVAERRVTDSISALRDLLGPHLDHLEALFEHDEAVTGVPTGFIDLDQQLAGLQPSNLMIVGGRPGTGKALAVDTPIPTPTGWTTMGELEVGAEVLSAAGAPCQVTFTTPVMDDRTCYEVLSTTVRQSWPTPTISGSPTTSPPGSRSAPRSTRRGGPPPIRRFGATRA